MDGICFIPAIWMPFTLAALFFGGGLAGFALHFAIDYDRRARALLHHKGP